MSTATSTSEFLGLVESDEGISVLPMVDRLLGGSLNSMFGGVGLAAGIIALEHLSQRPPVFMSCQFASTVAPPGQLTFSTEVLVSGKSVSQGRVTATSQNRPILSMFGACGSRREDHRSFPMTMPDAPPPDDCTPLQRHSDLESLHDHVDVRMARGAFGFAPDDATGRGTISGDATTLLWTRMANVHHDVGALAIMADYLPSAVGNALGQQVFCSSLDNVIRFTGPREPDTTSEWVLLESHVEHVGDGFASNRGLMWSRDGQLLASANQSVTVAAPRP